jgi:hypothetical protein
VQMGRKSGLSAYKFGPAVGGPASQIGITDAPPAGATPPPVVAAPVTTAPAKLALKNTKPPKKLKSAKPKKK